MQLSFQTHLNHRFTVNALMQFLLFNVPTLVKSPVCMFEICEALQSVFIVFNSPGNLLFALHSQAEVSRSRRSTAVSVSEAQRPAGGGSSTSESSLSRNGLFGCISVCLSEHTLPVMLADLL